MPNLRTGITSSHLLAIPFILSAATCAVAADWEGNNSTDWFETGNWVGGVLPITGDDVVIDTPNQVIVDGNQTPDLGLLTVGNNDTGALTIQNGGVANINFGFVGYGSNSEGTITVSGQRSTLNNASRLIVGSVGTGALTIQNGGMVSNSSSVIGSGSNSEGTVTVSGSGSSWVNTAALTVGGSEAIGTLTVENGGIVSNTTGTIGSLPGSKGTVTVGGSGSSWVNSEHLTIGNSGTAALTIANGGMVSNTFGSIGSRSGGEGTVTVRGMGSNWGMSEDLHIGSSGTGTLTIVDGGHVSTTAFVQITSGVIQGSGTGTINIGTALGETAAAPGTVSADLVHFGKGTGTLTFNHTDETGTYVFAPRIISSTGTSAIGNHAGFTRLAGDSSGFAQTTTIHGGTLAIDNMLGGIVNVMGGGTLSGAGTATGDVTFDDGSYYLVEMDGTTDPQGLAVGGTTTLDGTVMLTGNVVGIAGKGDVVILTTDTMLSTEFDGVTADLGSIFLTPTLSYEMDGGTDYVFVSVDQTTDFTDVAQTPNQKAVAGGLDGLVAGNPLYDAVALIGSVESARDAFDQLSGQSHAALQGALLENGQKTVQAVNQRMQASFADAIGGTSVAAYGSTNDPANGFWMTGYGNWMTTDATANTAELTNNMGGVVAGFDRQLGDHARLGVLGGYARTDTRLDALASSANADSYTIGLYGGTEHGNANISAGALYSWHMIDSTRTVSNPVSEILVGDYDAQSYQLFAEAGYKAHTDIMSIEPFAGVSHINVKMDSFTETGGTAALVAQSSTTATTFTTLGLRGAAKVGKQVHLSAMAGWRHAFGDIDPGSTFTVAGSAPFSITGAPIAEDAAVVEAGIGFAANDNVRFSASYQGQFANGAMANGFDARLLAAF